MKVPVRSQGLLKEVSIDFAEAIPASLFAEWSAALDSAGTEPQRDTLEFLECVVDKWAFHEGKRRVVRSAIELQARVEQEPTGEVLGVLVASADWYRDGAVVGFCEFRRTWCNNVAYDFLGIHPSLLVPATRDISGLAMALLYRLGLLAVDLKAGQIWAETTDTSAGFYERIFNVAPLADLLVMDAEDFLQPLVSAIEEQRNVR